MLLKLFSNCFQNGKNSDSDSYTSLQRDLSGSFNEHHLDMRQLSEKFSMSKLDIVDPKVSRGLSKQVAAERLESDGRNALSPPKVISNWKLFLRQFKNLLWILMFGAAALSLVAYIYDPSDLTNLCVGIFIIVIIFVMCIVSFFEEKKGVEVVRAFQSLMPLSCQVIRDGVEQTLNPEELVVGDIVVVRSGCKVPADIRVIACTDFYLETSSITGEAEPLEFNSAMADQKTSIFESYNIAFNGSFCVDGEGYGIVIRTGERTVIGQIASMTLDQKEQKCKFQVEIGRFVKFITVMAIIMAVIIFSVGLGINKGHDVIRYFVTGFLMVIIANVPQGLPTTVTTELTIIARRMAKKNVFLKKLEKIDSVGATTLIASDKTGTLTKNCMTVTDLWYNNSYNSGRPENRRRSTKTRFSITSNPAQSFDAPLSDLLSVVCVCNKARIENTVTVNRPPPNVDSELDMSMYRIQPVKEMTIVGNPSEVALLRYASAMLDAKELRESFQVVFEIPFNSVRKYHLILATNKNTWNQVDKNDDVEFVVMIKGAPEVLIKNCSTMNINGESKELDLKRMEDFNEAYEAFGDEGCRVIGFAQKKFRARASTVFSLKSNTVPMEDWDFLGMSAIMDPPRDDTPKAIKACKAAGIKVYMVTGDHKSTATAIARQIGMIDTEEVSRVDHNQQIIRRSNSQDWAVITGSELPALTQKQWDELLQHRYIVFARTTPEHKLMIVTESQKRGECVTVTGDGVNDAPALKKADVGVAMGLAGSDVAKQAADIILLDDNFSSIVAGIEEGRLLFDNLRKTIAYTMAHMWPELVPVILNFFFGFPLGLTPVQILSIDLISDIPPAVSLAYEGPEADIMLQPPRKKDTHLVTKGLITYTYLFMSIFISIGCVCAYLLSYYINGIGPWELAFTASTYFKHGAANFTTAKGVILNEEQQMYMANQAAAAFHISLVLGQAFHLWMCLTRRVSIFAHGLGNIVAIFAVIIDLLLICIFTFVPGVKYIFGSQPPPWQCWLVPIVVGVWIWIFNELRKLGIRKYPKNKFVRLTKW
ncbi:Cation-transporting P-type ATPase N-terminal domain-containing protein [Caenorhabditis elegans]|uniref:Cation-transporting P-type ATPase N-terminal domain-containing protein n=1 Tax=Caenorhabditis elegans TaxID=6239 RepID=A0A131MBN3_CAEEL|nr:Cation-transporting P-type ATPase N-terminal domain-containing protein [Caenorhabditis elegans]CZR14537.1 Cation-transporting P-type ATPase N-terminal domain-containing protein [Caenorhabditis elegans]|eukprot:NP_001309616.1 Cation transporting ATPase [Caenorhabditis elegans]